MPGDDVENKVTTIIEIKCMFVSLPVSITKGKGYYYLPLHG